MKTIIAGSRNIKDYETVAQIIKASGFVITEVVSGTAAGVDSLGEAWAQINEGPVKQFPADWKRHGKGAGYIRNSIMADYADALIAIWDGTSKGTNHMIKTAINNGLRVYVGKV